MLLTNPSEEKGLQMTHEGDQQPHPWVCHNEHTINLLPSCMMCVLCRGLPIRGACRDAGSCLEFLISLALPVLHKANRAAREACDEISWQCDDPMAKLQ
jgi:hypothetical protein